MKNLCKCKRCGRFFGKEDVDICHACINLNDIVTFDVDLERKKILVIRKEFESKSNYTLKDIEQKLSEFKLETSKDELINFYQTGAIDIDPRILGTLCKVCSKPISHGHFCSDCHLSPENPINALK